MIIIKKHKKLIVSLLFIILPIIYISFGHKLVDKYIYTSAINDMNKLIENKYTGSIKDNVKTKDIEFVNSKIKFIYDKRIKTKLLNDTEKILKQAKLQRKVLDNTKKVYKEKNYSLIKTELITKNIEDSKYIKNHKVKKKILKENYEVKDRLEKTNKAKEYIEPIYERLDSLSLDDLQSYYVSLGLVENIYYSSVKNDLKTKLTKIDKKLSDIIKENNSNSKKSLNEQIDGIEKGTYVFNQSVTSLELLEKNEYKAFDFFNKNNFNYVIIIDNNNLSIYKKGNYKSINSETINNKLDSTIKNSLKNTYATGIISDNYIKEHKVTINSSSASSDSSINSSVNNSSDSSSESSTVTQNISIPVLKSTVGPSVNISTEDITSSLIVSNNMFNTIKSYVNKGIAIID